MNSAVKQLPHSMSKTLASWAALSCLLMALPALGQGFSVTQPTNTVIQDATLVAGTLFPAKASPYPSLITISNQYVGTIQKAAVVLNGLDHSYANDVDILLVAPNATKIRVLSDVALNFPFANVSLELRATGASLPASGPVVSGIYGTTDYARVEDGADDTFLDPALGPPWTDTLDGVVGISPTGVWQLFVMDDKPSDTGNLASWAIKLWTTPVFVKFSTNNVVTYENIQKSFTYEFNDTDTPANSVEIKAVALDTALVSNTNIVVSATGKVRTINITPNLNRFGATKIRVTAFDGITTITDEVDLQILEVNQPPTITLNTNAANALAGGFSTTVRATVADPDSAVNDLSVIAISSDPNIVATNLVVDVTKTGATRDIVIAPRGTATGVVTLTLLARDTGGTNNVSTSGAQLTFTINPVTQALYANSTNIVIPDDGSVVARSVTVTNVFGKVARVVATVNGLVHPNPADVEAKLKGPGGVETLLLSANGGADDANGAFLSLDDNATGALPTPLVSGTYDPNQPLSVFNDGDPNGTWTLEVKDTVASNAGSIIGGFNVKLFTAPEVRNLINTNLNEASTKDIAFTAADFDGSVTNIIAVSSDTSKAEVQILSFAAGPVATATLRIIGKPDQNGAVTVTVTAKDNTGGYTGLKAITVMLNPVNTAPNISPIPKQATYAGIPLGPIPFTVNDKGPSGTGTDETPAGNIVVTAVSDNPKFVPDGNIVLGGSGENRTFTIFPLGNQSGTVTITIRARDSGVPGDPLTSSTQFSFQVLPPASPLLTNPGSILIADSGTNLAGASNGATNAAPYPSSIPVSGLNGLIRKMIVTLVGVKHPRPEDLGVLLVGPGTSGKKIVLASGAGGTTPASDVQLVFADSGGALPDGSQLGSGLYAPSNYDGRTASDFPNTSSGESTLSTTLSAFNGTSPNGTWNLYVRDFTGNTKGDGQIIALGWMVNFETDIKLAAIPDQVTDEDTEKRVALDIGDEQPGVPLEITATSDNASLIPNSPNNIKVEPGIVASKEQTLRLIPVANGNGVANITVTARIPGGVPDSKTFKLTVNAVNDEPLISGPGSENRSQAAGLINGPLVVNAIDRESAASLVNLTASSSDTGLVPNSNIKLERIDNDGNWNITIVPNGVETGTVTITLSAQVGTERSGSKPFTYSITRSLSFRSGDGAIAIRDNSTASPYPSVANVSGVVGAINSIRVTLLGLTHTFPDDIDVLLVSPDGSKAAILMADIGGGAPTNSISNLTLTFADGGEVLTTGEEKLKDRTYAPASFGGGGWEPGVLPPGGASTNLAVFKGLSPNGAWKLYIRDDTFSDDGVIAGGWILNVSTAPSIASIGAQVTDEDVPLNISVLLADSDTESQNLKAWALSSDEILVNNTNLVITPTNTYDRNLRLTPQLNRNGTNTITVYVADNTTTNSTSFHLTVRAIDDAPLVNTATNLVIINEDNQTNITFVVSDVDSVLSVTNASASSGNADVLPNSTNNITIAGPVSVTVGDNANMVVTVKPASNAFGDTTVTFGQRDGSSTTPKEVVLRVLPVNDAPTVVPSTNKYSVVAGGSLVDIPVTVGDVETLARDITFTATSGDPNIIPNVNLITGGANANRLLTITTVGNVAVGTDVTVFLKVRDTDAAATNILETITNIVVSVSPAPGKVFANEPPRNITIRDNNTAQPYPSPINVSGLVGAIHQVIITLDGLTHTVPDDIDALLVGPTGKKVTVLSDAGGTVPVSNARLVFDDNALAPILDSGPMEAGVFKVSAYQDGDVFPSPAPAAPYDSALGTFFGTNPNGAWSLYLADDTASDTGYVTNGWSLKIITTPTIATSTSSPIEHNEDTTAQILLQVADSDAGTKLNGLEPFFQASNGNLMPSGSVTFTRTAGDPDAGGGPWNYTATLNPAANFSGTNLLTIGFRRTSDRAVATVQFAHRVLLQNDRPEISRITEKTTDENTPIDISFLVTDVDSTPGQLSIEATSGNPTLISNANLLFFGQTNRLAALPSNNVDLRLRPNTSQVGDAEITITVTDNSTNAPAQSAQSKFLLRVTPFNDPPTITAIPDIAIPAGQSTTNILFTVADVDSGTVKVNATSDDQTLVKDSSIQIFMDAAGTIPGGGDVLRPTGARYIRVTSEVGRRGTANISIVANDGSKNSTPRVFAVNIVESRERPFSNPVAIVLNDNSAASPYPSGISVDGLVGDVDTVRVKLNGFAHPFPSDIDLLLVAPNGKGVVLMSDAGGGTSVTNINLTFSDAAAADVPQTALASGDFRPKNYDPQGDPFPAGPPAGPYQTKLGDLAGSPAKGEWRLYAVDDTPSDAGFITGGWQLFITTRPRIVGLVDATIGEDDVFSQPFTIVEEPFADPTFSFASQSTNTAVVTTNNVTFRGSGTNWTVNVVPVENASGTTKITVFAKNPYQQIVTNFFSLNVLSRNDSPTITQLGDELIFSGTATPERTFSYGDAETTRKDLTLTISSSNPGLIPTNNIYIVGGTISVAPVGNLAGASDITIRVTDPAGAFDETQFRVTVVRSLNPQFADSGVITIPATVGKATPYPSSIPVSGVVGAVARVTVTLAGLTHGYPSDLDVMLVGPGGQKAILMSDAGGSAGLESARFTFDERNTNAMPFNPSVPIPNGTYKTTNHAGSPDNFPDAPAGPIGPGLGVFNGTDANGTWSLFVVDSFAGFGGAISGGWILNIFTTEPTISQIGDQVTDENVAISVPFRVEDADTPVESLITAASTDRPELLGLAITGTNSANRVLTITPVPYASGSASVTVAVTDGRGVASTRFTVTVNPLNQAPILSGLSDQSIPSNLTLQLPFTVFDRETPADQLAVSANVLQPSFGTAGVSGSGTNRTLVFRPSGTEGQTFITVTAGDGELSTTNTISIAIGVPYSLTVSPIADQSTSEDVAASVAFTVAGSRTGNITPSAEVASPGIVDHVEFTGSGTNWTAKIVPMPDATGSTAVTIIARDEFGSGSEEFLLTVSAAPDGPVIGTIPDQTTVANVAVTVVVPVSDPDTAIADLDFEGTASNPAVVQHVAFANDGTTVTATVHLVANASGVSTVTVTADDGTSTASQSFALTVSAPPNLPPTLGPIADRESPKNVPVIVPLVVSDPDTAISSLIFTGTSSNTNLVRSVVFGLAGETNVVATVNLRSGQIGSASVTISVNDGRTTASQSFLLTVVESIQPPVLQPIADQTTVENQNVTVALDVTDADSQLTDLVFSSKVSNPTLVTDVTFNVTATSATATLVLGKDVVGLSTVTIGVTDGANSDEQTFALQVTAAPPPELKVSFNPANRTVTVTWTNGGELEVAESPIGPWVGTGDTSGSLTALAEGKARFARVRR